MPTRISVLCAAAIALALLAGGACNRSEHGDARPSPAMSPVAAPAPPPAAALPLFVAQAAP